MQCIVAHHLKAVSCMGTVCADCIKREWSLCCRAGLYKQLAELKALVAEFREGPSGRQELRQPIVAALNAAGASYFGHRLRCSPRRPSCLQWHGHLLSALKTA